MRLSELTKRFQETLERQGDMEMVVEMTGGMIIGEIVDSGIIRDINPLSDKPPRGFITMGPLNDKPETDTIPGDKRLINRTAFVIAELFEELLERHGITFTKPALKPTEFEGIEKALANCVPRICDEDHDELIKDITTVLERFRSSDGKSDGNEIRIHHCNEKER